MNQPEYRLKCSECDSHYYSDEEKPDVQICADCLPGVVQKRDKRIAELEAKLEDAETGSEIQAESGDRLKKRIADLEEAFKGVLTTVDAHLGACDDAEAMETTYPMCSAIEHAQELLGLVSPQRTGERDAD